MDIKITDQKDKDGVVIDKIATITRYEPKTTTFSKTEVENQKQSLIGKLDVLQLQLDELNAVLDKCLDVKDTEED